MLNTVLSSEQRLLYYHLIDYPKIVSIMDMTLNLSCSEAETSTKLRLASAFEVIKTQCIAACDFFGENINDPFVIRMIKSKMSSSQLIEIGMAVFQDVMDITMPLLVFLRYNSLSLEEISQKRRIRESLSEVLNSVKQTIPVPKK